MQQLIYYKYLDFGKCLLTTRETSFLVEPPPGSLVEPAWTISDFGHADLFCPAQGGFLGLAETALGEQAALGLASLCNTSGCAGESAFHLILFFSDELNAGGVIPDDHAVQGFMSPPESLVVIRAGGRWADIWKAGVDPNRFEYTCAGSGSAGQPVGLQVGQ